MHHVNEKARELNQSPDLDRMVDPNEARAMVLAHCRRLPVEQVSISEAAGRILAEPLISADDHPPFAAATMDGYAVVAADPSPWREVIGVQTAGFVLAVEVTEGYAVRITTGAPMPPGADAVVPVENTELADDHVVITQDLVRVGENVRPIGSDIARGTEVLPVGVQLGPAEIGLIAGLGAVPVPVRRAPRVAVLSTGDELAEPDDPVAPGQIRDSNRFSLVTALQDAGAEVTWSGKAPDSYEQLEALLRRLTASCDVVVTSGGVSMGELDLVKPLLASLGDVKFRRVFLKPGKPMTFATVGDAIVFGLPGNPVSALVSFEMFIRPALRTMMGAREIDRPRVPVVLREPAMPSDRIELQRATIVVDPSGRLMAVPTGSQASSRLASFVGANAFLVIAPRQTPYTAGETVEAMLLAAPIAEASR